MMTMMRTRKKMTRTRQTMKTTMKRRKTRKSLRTDGAVLRKTLLGEEVRGRRYQDRRGGRGSQTTEDEEDECSNWRDEEDAVSA